MTMPLSMNPSPIPMRRRDDRTYRHGPMRILSAIVQTFISGVAGLMAFTALASPPVRPAKAASAHGCHLAVFVNDPDPAGLNLRRAPGTESHIVATIVDGDAMLDVTGSSGKWLRVERARGADGTVQFKGEAWVFGPLTAVRANRAVALQAAPQLTSPVVTFMAAEDSGAVQACDATWVRVRYGKSDGWIPPGAHCGNSVTGCV